MCRARIAGNDLSTFCGARIASDLRPSQQMIDVMLHVENIVFYDEPQRLHAPPDHAAILQMLVRNAVDHTNEQGIVAIPKINQRAPLDVPVSMRLHPFVLRIALSAELAIDRGQDKTQMVVCCRVDQMTKFLLACPTAGSAIVL